MPRPKISEKNRKSERISLIVKPKTKERIIKIAFMRQMSVNDLLQSVLDNYIDKHRADLKRYDEAFPETVEKED